VVCFLSKKQKTVCKNCLDVTAHEIQQKWYKEKIIPCEVPQGSILRLLLFLIYVNDTETNKRNDLGIKLTLFDDNTCILINGKDIQDLIFNLDRINGSILHWFDKKKTDYK
jgi:hypothetical protein